MEDEQQDVDRYLDAAKWICSPAVAFDPTNDSEEFQFDKDVTYDDIDVSPLQQVSVDESSEVYEEITTDEQTNEEIILEMTEAVGHTAPKLSKAKLNLPINPKVICYNSQTIISAVYP